MSVLRSKEALVPKADGAEESLDRKKKTPKKLPKVIQDRILIAAICLTVVFVGLCVYFFGATVAKGASAAHDAYIAAKEHTEKSIYQMFYDAAEARYHTSNEVTISVESIREEANLEVLRVSDVEYIVQEGDDTNKGITSWLEVPGEGVFTVDLKASEFVIDNQHHYILARIPNPVLSNCEIIYKDAVQLEYKNNFTNDSIKDGEDLARTQYKEAYIKIWTEFTSNQQFFLAAQSAAKTMVTNLIKSFNPDIPDLVVDVEFIE